MGSMGGEVTGEATGEGDSGESRNPDTQSWTPASAGVTGEWTYKWWFADAAEIRAADFNLSASRFRPMAKTVVEHRDPRELLDELAAIEAEIQEEIEALRASLSEGV
jgi:type I restriction enzyme M protein